MMIGQIVSASLDYVRRVATALSILINVVLGGMSNQTIAARNWELKRRNKLNVVVLIDYMKGKGYCLLCWTHWRLRSK